MALPRPLSWQAAVAAVGAVVLWLASTADALPWPHPAGPSLASLLLLVAVTRVTGDMGIAVQRRLRYAVAGVAIAAASWFSGLAVVGSDPALLLLAGLHLITAWLAAFGEPDADERRRGIAMLAASACALSLLALAVPSRDGAALGEVVTAGVLATGVVLAARGRIAGGAIAALGAAAALVSTAVHLTEWFAASPSAVVPAHVPLVAGTCAAAGIAAIAAFTRDLPALWEALAPRASARTRHALVVASVPGGFALAGIALLWTGF